MAPCADGQSHAAVEFVEAKAKAFPKGPFRRELVKVYREQKEYDRAEPCSATCSRSRPTTPTWPRP